MILIDGMLINPDTITYVEVFAGSFSDKDVDADGLETDCAYIHFVSGEQKRITINGARQLHEIVYRWARHDKKLVSSKFNFTYASKNGDSKS